MKDLLTRENIRRESGEGGFFRILGIIIIIVVILAVLGFDADGIWQNTIKPAVEFVFRLAVIFFDFVVGLVTKALSFFGL